MTGADDGLRPAQPPSREVPTLQEQLRRLTPARVALGRRGASLPTQAVLSFGVAHALARDAVHAALDGAALRAALGPAGAQALEVRSAAPDRAAYLARPDWGRRLDPRSARVLADYAAAASAAESPDLVVVFADGLSAVAAQRHAPALWAALQAGLSTQRLAPPVIATQARVALADEIGAAMRARLALILIGERPGLSSPDSLGAYLTADPRPGRSDAERNCVSNIHAAGLSTETAATQILGLIRAAQAAGVTGVGLNAQALPAPAR